MVEKEFLVSFRAGRGEQAKKIKKLITPAASKLGAKQRVSRTFKVIEFTNVKLIKPKKRRSK